MTRERGDRAAGWISIVVVVIGCTGCTGPTLAPAPNLYWATGENPYGEVPEVLRTTTAEIVYATDREPEHGKNGEIRYGYRRSQSLAVGIAKVELGKNLTWEQLVQASTTRDRDEAISLSISRIEELARLPPSNTPLVEVDGQRVESPEYIAARDEGLDRIGDVIRERLAMSPRKDVYLYVHGYNNSFDFAAFRMATIWHYLGRQGVPLLYTWPAGHPGLLRGYTYDRESSEFTIFHLKQLVRALERIPEIEHLHVVGHSRGTDVVLSTMREEMIAKRAAGEARPSRLGNVVIAAADMDWEVTQQRIVAERVIANVDNLVFYLSEDDKALGISQWLFGSLSRLGDLTAAFLSREQQASLEQNKELQVVDANVRSGLVGHAYFVDNPAVLSDLILVLRDGKRAGAENGRPLQPLGNGFWKITDDYLVPHEKGMPRRGAIHAVGPP